jgi:hypothetical protein
VHAAANCPRHVDLFPSIPVCLSVMFESESLLCGQGTAPRCSRTSTSIHANREGTRAAGGVSLDSPHGDGHGQ